MKIKKCKKTTSGNHYWQDTCDDYDNKVGVWLQGTIFVNSIRTCLACGLIDDLLAKSEKCNHLECRGDLPIRCDKCDWTNRQDLLAKSEVRCLKCGSPSDIAHFRGCPELPDIMEHPKQKEIEKLSVEVITLKQFGMTIVGFSTMKDIKQVVDIVNELVEAVSKLNKKN